MFLETEFPATIFSKGILMALYFSLVKEHRHAMLAGSVVLQEIQNQNSATIGLKVTNDVP